MGGSPWISGSAGECSICNPGKTGTFLCLKEHRETEKKHAAPTSKGEEIRNTPGSVIQKVERDGM